MDFHGNSDRVRHSETIYIDDTDSRVTRVPTWRSKWLVLVRDRRHNTGPSTFARGDFHNFIKKAKVENPLRYEVECWNASIHRTKICQNLSGKLECWYNMFGPLRDCFTWRLNTWCVSNFLQLHILIDAPAVASPIPFLTLLRLSNVTWDKVGVSWVRVDGGCVDNSFWMFRWNIRSALRDAACGSNFASACPLWGGHIYQNLALENLEEWWYDFTLSDILNLRFQECTLRKAEGGIEAAPSVTIPIPLDGLQISMETAEKGAKSWCLCSLLNVYDVLPFFLVLGRSRRSRIFLI